MNYILPYLKEGFNRKYSKVDDSKLLIHKLFLKELNHYLL